MSDQNDRKPYITPELVEFGSASELTQGLGSGVPPDGGGGQAPTKR